MSEKKKKDKSTGRVRKVGKRVAKKTKKVAKTDAGRAGIGAGIGAVALGPIGAVAGAGIAMATKKSKKKRGHSAKKNPIHVEKGTRLSSIMSNLLLDYAAYDDRIDSLAQSSMRGDPVTKPEIKRARLGLSNAISSGAISGSEVDQASELISALKMVEKKLSNINTNPSLMAAVKRARLSKATKSLKEESHKNKIEKEIKGKSTRSKLAKIRNPNHFLSQIPTMSDDALIKERIAINSLIRKSKSVDAVPTRATRDMKLIRSKLTEEISNRRKMSRMSSGRSSRGHISNHAPSPNPKVRGRLRGQYHSMFTPSQSDIDLLRKYNMLDKIEGKSPKQIEVIVNNLRNMFTPSKRDIDLLKKYNMLDKMEGKSPEEIRAVINNLIKKEESIGPIEYMYDDRGIDSLAKKYRNIKENHMKILASRDSSPGDIARSQRRLDEAEREIMLYAEIKNMDKNELMFHFKRSIEKHASFPKRNPTEKQKRRRDRIRRMKSSINRVEEPKVYMDQMEYGSVFIPEGGRRHLEGIRWSATGDDGSSPTKRPKTPKILDIRRDKPDIMMEYAEDAETAAAIRDAKRARREREGNPPTKTKKHGTRIPEDFPIRSVGKGVAIGVVGPYTHVQDRELERSSKGHDEGLEFGYMDDELYESDEFDTYDIIRSNPNKNNEDIKELNAMRLLDMLDRIAVESNKRGGGKFVYAVPSSRIGIAKDLNEVGFIKILNKRGPVKTLEGMEQDYYLTITLKDKGAKFHNKNLVIINKYIRD